MQDCRNFRIHIKTKKMKKDILQILYNHMYHKDNTISEVEFEDIVDEVVEIVENQ